MIRGGDLELLGVEPAKENDIELEAKLCVIDEKRIIIIASFWIFKFFFTPTMEVYTVYFVFFIHMCLPTNFQNAHPGLESLSVMFRCTFLSLTMVPQCLPGGWCCSWCKLLES